MPLNLPEGKRFAVNIGADFDAHAAWMGSFNLTSPSYLSRGEFGAEVGVPRILNLLRRHDIRATFCTPTHTMATFPEQFRAIVDAGHEIAAHGCYHEAVPTLDPAEERRLMEVTLQQHQKYVGVRPRGYRSPAWDFTALTPALLDEFGFDWDSSLMGRDFQPYHPRPVVTLDRENGNTFGEPAKFLEFPVSWYLDDFPPTEYVPGMNPGFTPINALLEQWIAQFDYAYANEPNGVLCLTVHPQCIGRAHHITALERFIEHVGAHDGTWFASLSEIYDVWAEK
ncbi:polysaccharide deacetylase [Streptomyces sp. NPDC059474]|uniref:polysaccharide deacetylase family protein n=1 Tax=Streptomyces sp. NPDC059474 TaxID=3346846 RepID=UPI0036D1B67E